MPTTNAIETETTVLNRAERLILGALQTGVSTEATTLLEAALELETLNVDKPRQLKLILDAARFFYVTGKPDAGLALGINARKLSVETADASSAAAALTVIGICAADTGNLPMAMEAYSDALSLAQKNEDVLREGKTWNNLGAALMYSGLYREAIECFQRALDFTRRSKELLSAVSSLHTNISLCFLHLDEISQGLAAINKAAELSREPSDATSVLDRVLIESNFVKLLIEAGDFDAARSHAKSARKFASMAKTPRADIIASLAEGLAEVFSGQADIGISRLTATFERAVSLKVTAREALVALVKAHEHIGQHDKALEYLNMMLEQQRKTQAANVLQHVKRHLEQLHVADKDSPIEDASQIIKKLLTRAEVFEGRVAKSELQKRDKELFIARVEVMERLAVAAELRDDSTGEHSYRVGRLSSLLAKSLGCDADTIFMIDIAARLHDIGKVGIPDGILLKPDKLNESEREVMKTHTTIGAQVLAQSQIPHMQMAEEIARCHHEWWDGNGYPSGLAGEQIPLAARITAIVDVYDALTHKRAYKHAWTEDSALTEILALRGRQFEPRLTDAFLALISSLRREYSDMDALLGHAAKASPFIIARTRIQETLELNRQPGDAVLPDRFDLQR